jgi:DNA-binding XRE family transcriptional regulator
MQRRGCVTEVQKITLADVFRQAGLTERQIEDIFLLLFFKPENVQQAFYYVSVGFTHEETAKKIGVSRQQVGLYITNNCEDLRKYLLAS